MRVAIPVHMWKSQDNFWESNIDSKYQTQVIGLAWQILLPFEPSLLARINNLNHAFIRMGRKRTWKTRPLWKASLVPYHPQHWLGPSPGISSQLPELYQLNPYSVKISYTVGPWAMTPELSECETLPYHLPALYLLQLLSPSRFPRLLNGKVRASTSLVVLLVLFS